MKNAIVYLFGFSGTGKYTVAKALAQAAPFIVIDNQLINAPIFTAVGADGIKSLHPGVWLGINEIRNAVFNTVIHIAAPELSFIFTNELFAHSEGDMQIFHRIETIASIRKSGFIPVRLLCDREELLRRVVSAERKAKHKMTNADELAMRLETIEILKPDHPHLLELDITAMTPQDAASHILSHINKIIN